VRVRPIARGDHRVEIDTQGVVESRREVTLAAEVGGRVLSIAPRLEAGGEVAAGEVLAEIDPTDYEATLAQAKSALAEARLVLAQERARAEQAASDWAKLGRGEATDLALRKPQIAAAEARVESARAEVGRAARDVERTLIRAPFDARVRAAEIETGAVVMPGNPVATLFSGTELEVRLPFPLRDFGFLTRGAEVEFELTATIGGEKHVWPARLDRLTGEVERATLSGHGIARVMPAADGGYPPVGLFVEAAVPGKRLEDVVEIPRSAIRGRDEVWVAADGRLALRRVEVLRSRRESLVVRGDFQPADRLVLTRLAAPLEGMKVEVVGESEAATPEAGS
jgi:RND family efflux transporter MFP subunit